MDLEININIDGKRLQMNKTKFQKLIFLYNSLENGWSIKKLNNSSYILKKKHEGKKEIFSDDFLTAFMVENFNMNNIFS